MKISENLTPVASRTWITLFLALLILNEGTDIKAHWLRPSFSEAYLFDLPNEKRERHSSLPGDTANSDLPTLEIQVTEITSQNGIPCRITIINEQGTPCAYRKFRPAIEFLHLQEVSNDTICLPHHSDCVIVLSRL